MNYFQNERRELSNANDDIKALVRDFKANTQRARNAAVREFLRMSFVTDMRNAGAYEAEIDEAVKS